MLVFEPMPHEAAVRRIAGLPLVTREVMDELLPELRAFAFCVTGLDAFDQLARVRDLIAAVPAGTKTWEKARAQIAAELKDDLGGAQAMRRAELLLRTHTFRGYAAARYRHLMEQRKAFPFWQYKTHGDGRVRPSHAALNGKIFPAGHSVWQRIFPPWDWGCRCLVVPLLKKDVEGRRGADEGKAPEDRLIYDGDMADAIASAGMLPSGIKLNVSSTWSASPWSEAGTVQHTWQLVKERYADTPEVLKAFEAWAKKVKLPDQNNKTVWTWLNGPRKRVKKPSPASTQTDGFPADIAGIKVIKRLGGSTGADLVEDKSGGRWVMKRGASADHLREEALTDEIYRALGVPVPEARLYETAEGPVKLARFVQGVTLAEYLGKASEAEKLAVMARLQEHFVADALLGNWDVAGLGMDNILVDAAGIAWRIDNGGGLRFRAMGKRKTAAQWNERVEELRSMLDPAQNASSARVFAGITDAQLRQQLADLQNNAAGALSLAPDEVGQMLSRRLAWLEAELTPSAFTAAFAKEVKEARLMGKTHLGDKDLIEDTAILFWQEADENGAELTRVKLRLTEQGSAALVDALGESFAKLKPLAPTGRRVVPTDSFWGGIETALKHINYHAGDGNYNAAKLGLLDDALTKLKGFKGKTADELAMVQYYDQVINEAKAAVAAKKGTKFFTQYEPPLPAATAARRERGLEVKAAALEWKKKRKTRGFARAEGGSVMQQSAYRIERDGLEMSFIPWKEASGAPSSAPYALRGYVEMTVPGEASRETLGKAAELLKDAGIDVSAVTPAYSELLYLKKGLNLAALTPAKKKAAMAILDDAGLDEGLKLNKLKAWVSKNLKDVDLEGPSYQPNGRASSFGVGWQHWERWDLPRSVIEKEMADYTLTHSPSGAMSDLIESLLDGGGQFTPTTERLRTGVPINSGMSPMADLSTGGANYLFTRIKAKSAVFGTVLQFKIGNLARMDAFSFGSDRYGDVRPASESTRGDPYKARGTTLDKFREFSSKAGNETIFKWGLNLLDEVEQIRCGSTAERQAVLAVFKKHKYTILPDGRKIEDVVK